jgi:hypothetical protein
MSETRRLVALVTDLGAGGGEVIDTLADLGYDFDGVERKGGEFVATATKVVGVTPYQASALGRTKIDAARALVKTITRP